MLFYPHPFFDPTARWQGKSTFLKLIASNVFVSAVFAIGKFILGSAIDNTAAVLKEQHNILNTSAKSTLALLHCICKHCCRVDLKTETQVRLKLGSALDNTAAVLKCASHQSIKRLCISF
jgi:hypothetical protein